MGPDGAGSVGAAGGVFVEGAGAPHVGAPAMHLGVIDGRDVVAVPEPAGGGLDQPGQPPGNRIGAPGAVLGEALHRLPVVRPLQGQDGLSDGVLLDVKGHGGDPLGEAAESAVAEASGEGVHQVLPGGPDERSFGHDASPVLGPDGVDPTW